MSKCAITKCDVPTPSVANQFSEEQLLASIHCQQREILTALALLSTNLGTINTTLTTIDGVLDAQNVLITAGNASLVTIATNTTP